MSPSRETLHWHPIHWRRIWIASTNAGMKLVMKRLAPAVFGLAIATPTLAATTLSTWTKT